MRIAVLFAACIILAAVSQAVPTGLNAMPTADIMPFGMTRMEWQLNDSGYLYAPTHRRVLGTQTGMGPGVLEGGVDEVSGVGTVYNMKLALSSESYSMPAIAIGVQNVGGHTKNQFYLVGGKILAGGQQGDTTAIRFHGGVLSDDNGDVRSMVGGDIYVGGARITTDRISGSSTAQARTSVGITGIAYDVYRAPRTITLMATYSYSSGG
jgi:hypothetical protein